MSEQPQLDSKLERQPADLDAHRNRLLSRAQAIFGDALTTVIVTGRWPVPHRNGRPARPLTERQEATLRNAVNIAERLLKVEASATVQAWFVGRNPRLSDRAPAILVSSAPDAVREAAEYFLVYG